MIRPLAESDDPFSFSCGVRELDAYLRHHAMANAAAGIGATYVVEDREVGIGGYVTLAAAGVRADELGLDARVIADLPRYPLPALLIARLAVDERCRRLGLGRGLLLFALDEALVARDRVGCVGALVDAKPAAIGFLSGTGSSRSCRALPTERSAACSSASRRSPMPCAGPDPRPAVRSLPRHIRVVA